MNRHKYIQVVCTIDSKTGAQKLCEKIVRAGLAACGQISGPIESIYWWQEKLEHAVEYYCIFKTTAQLYKKIESAIKKLHHYQTPEIVAFDICAGFPDYLKWITTETADQPHKIKNVIQYCNRVNLIKKYKNLAFNIANKEIVKTASSILANLEISGAELNIVLVSDSQILPLNKEYRNKNMPTDVLSFNIDCYNPESELNTLGEIIISIDRALAQAELYDVPLKSEFYRLLIHGILHLTGMTHKTAASLRKMNDITDGLLTKIGC